MNACNLPKYTLEHVWECFWAFGSGTKNDAKRVHFGTRMHFFRVAQIGWIFSQRTHAIFLIIPNNMFGSVFEHSVPERKMMQNGCISAPECIFPGSETRVDFFATNACNLPNYTLQHVWECF